MLTAFLSLLSGLFSGIVPELIKEVRETRAAAREREFMEAQSRMQLEAAKIQAEDKLRESQSDEYVAELRATREYLTAIVEAQSKPSGFAWIDGLNAVLRPIACLGIMALFFWVGYHYCDGVLQSFAAKKIDVAMLNTALWSSLVGESFIGVFGFLFGYRSARKAAV